ncbi:protein kinase domain-containing protein [Streptomyces alanosinicus]|uniref:Protein kinase domain-containing protein n=1 Tax=Streptomyces alanosinicus TaxID=68171 RepID=A0A919CZP8_9ACTN|nr:serine/threonine-protein kinase [Streptomyces alanosinicus]GHD97964.1 hypothetical protein GCM10010339_02820 [Streptomyces alanosinicus]
MQSLRAADPRRIGPYDVTDRLGAGGMGEVYLARSRTGLRLAVKVVRVEHAEDRTFRARFRHEVQAAQTVGGAGTYTARVVDADTEAERPWMATEFVPGPNLRDAVLDHGALPGPAVRVLAAALGEALGAIHGKGLVHRDLKPSNILLGPDGPRVIDFGIVRALEATALTRTGAVVGSVGYVSPEQIRNGGQVGPPSDVFSLGAVLAYAAAGREPFGEGQDSVILLRILTRDFDLSGVPEDIRPLVTSCLREDPLKRPAPADVVARAGFTPRSLRHGTRPGWYGPAASATTTPDPHPSGVEYFSTPGSAPDPTPGSSPDSGPGSTPGSTLDFSPDSAPGSGPGSAPGSTLDFSPDSAPGSGPGSAPGSALDSAPGSTSDSSPGSAPGSTSGSAPGSVSASDPAPGSASDSAPDPAPLAPESGPRITSAPPKAPVASSSAVPTAVTPLSRSFGAVAPGRRRLLRLIAGGAVAAAGVGVAGWLSKRGTGTHSGGGAARTPDAGASGATATLRWQYDFGGIGGLDGPCCALSPDGSVVYVGTSDGSLHAISRDGSRRWKVRLGDGVGSPVATRHGVYCVVDFRTGNLRRLTAVSPSGSPLWTRTLGDRAYAVPVLLGDDVLVSIGGTDAGGLRRYGADGSTRWTVTTPAGPTGTPVVTADAVYTGSYGDALLALDARDGSQKWKVPAGTDVTALALVGSTLFTDAAALRQGFRITDGRRLWRSEAYTDGALTGAGRSLAVGTEPGTVYAVRAADGSKAWDHPIEGEADEPRAVVAGGTVYARFSDRVRALDLNGRTRWTADLGHSSGDDQHTPLIRGRRLYIPSGTGIAAVDVPA